MVIGKFILKKVNPEKHGEEEKVIDHISALDNTIIYSSGQDENKSPRNTKLFCRTGQIYQRLEATTQ